MLPQTRNAEVTFMHFKNPKQKFLKPRQSSTNKSNFDAYPFKKPSDNPIIRGERIV